MPRATSRPSSRARWIRGSLQALPFLVLASLCVGLLLETRVPSEAWHVADGARASSRASWSDGPFVRIASERPGRAAYRSWTLSSAAQAAQLSFEARSACAGAPDASTDVEIRLTHPDGTVTRHESRVGPSWTPVDLGVRPDPSATEPAMGASVLLLGACGIDVRNVEVRGAGDLRAEPRRQPIRYSAGVGEPNLTGHAAAAQGLVAASVASSSFLAVIALALALGVVVATGSQLALGALLLGGLAILLIGTARCRARRRVLATVAIVLIAAAGLIGLGSSRLYEGPGRSLARRVDIHRSALSAVLEHPSWGDRAARMEAFAASLGPEPVPTHAHNVALNAGLDRGIVGLLGALGVLGLAAVWIVVRWSRTGVVLVVCLGVLATFDGVLAHWLAWTAMVPLALLRPSDRSGPR